MTITSQLVSYKCLWMSLWLTMPSQAWVLCVKRVSTLVEINLFLQPSSALPTTRRIVCVKLTSNILTAKSLIKARPTYERAIKARRIDSPAARNIPTTAKYKACIVHLHPTSNQSIAQLHSAKVGRPMWIDAGITILYVHHSSLSLPLQHVNKRQ